MENDEPISEKNQVEEGATPALGEITRKGARRLLKMLRKPRLNEPSATIRGYFCRFRAVLLTIDRYGSK